MQGSVYLLCSLGGGIKRWWASDVCLSDVYVWRRLTSVAYIGSKSRTERPRKTINWHRVSHVTRDSDTTFKVKRPKVKVTQAALVGCSSHQITYLDANNLYVTAQSHYLHGAGAYCGGLPPTACCIAHLNEQSWFNVYCMLYIHIVLATLL